MSFNDIISSRYKTNVKVVVGEPLYQAPRPCLQVLLKKNSLRTLLRNINILDIYIYTHFIVQIFISKHPKLTPVLIVDNIIKMRKYYLCHKV